MWGQPPSLSVERSSTFLGRGSTTAETTAYSNRLVLHQPLHRFLPRLEDRQVALREALEMLIEYVRQTLRPHHAERFT